MHTAWQGNGGSGGASTKPTAPRRAQRRRDDMIHALHNSLSCVLTCEALHLHMGSGCI